MGERERDSEWVGVGGVCLFVCFSLSGFKMIRI